jgi:hypothetical protein
VCAECQCHFFFMECQFTMAQNIVSFFRRATVSSYISVLTVGLGDYYIEAEFLFMVDLLIFTFLFLTGKVHGVPASCFATYPSVVNFLTPCCSLFFLPGFTFLSTFLVRMCTSFPMLWINILTIHSFFVSLPLQDKTAWFCSGYFPDSGVHLEERLRNTNLVGKKRTIFFDDNYSAQR